MLHLLKKKKESGGETFLFRREIRYRNVLLSIVSHFHSSTPVIGEIDLSSPESGVFKKLGVSECPILI